MAKHDEDVPEPTDDRVSDAVNDDNGNPISALDLAPRQPSPTPADGPLRSRCPGETYNDYLGRCASFGAPSLDEAEWATL